MPSRIPGLLNLLEHPPADQALKCQITPLPPALDFSFRFRVRLRIQAPLEQFAGPGHRWDVLLRVTPDKQDSQPAYLASTYALPNVPTKPNQDGEVEGIFVVGEGRYRLKALVLDDLGRTCLGEWSVQARPSHSERRVQLAMAPNSVDAIGLPRPPDNPRNGTPIFDRLTVLMHAAPASLRDSVFQSSDAVMLIGSLASIVEQLPARSVRLVMFNFDQQKELLRQDDFSEGGLVQVAQTLGGLKLGTVDYRVLQKTEGHLDLLNEIINRELGEPSKADCVVFLGPQARYRDKPAPEAIERAAGPKPRFYYLEYAPFPARALMAPNRRSQAVGPPLGVPTDTEDSITAAVKQLGGKTFVFRSPADLADVLDRVRRAAGDLVTVPRH